VNILHFLSNLNSVSGKSSLTHEFVPVSLACQITAATAWICPGPESTDDTAQSQQEANQEDITDNLQTQRWH